MYTLDPKPNWTAKYRKAKTVKMAYSKICALFLVINVNKSYLLSPDPGMEDRKKIRIIHNSKGKRFLIPLLPIIYFPFFIISLTKE